MRVPQIPQAGVIAGWVLAALALAAGCLLLLGSWGWFHEMAVNGSQGRPPGWYPVIAFLYALPGFEAGLVAGLLLSAASSGVGHVLRVVNLTIWAELMANFAVVVYFFSRGALL